MNRAPWIVATDVGQSLGADSEAFLALRPLVAHLGNRSICGLAGAQRYRFGQGPNGP